MQEWTRSSAPSEGSRSFFVLSPRSNSSCSGENEHSVVRASRGLKATPHEKGASPHCSGLQILEDRLNPGERSWPETGGRSSGQGCVSRDEHEQQLRLDRASPPGPCHRRDKIGQRRLGGQTSEVVLGTWWEAGQAPQSGILDWRTPARHHPTLGTGQLASGLEASLLSTRNINGATA